MPINVDEVLETYWDDLAPLRNPVMLIALRGLFEAEDLFASAVVCGALTTEAVLGSRSPFDARIHAVRGQRASGMAPRTVAASSGNAAT